MVWLKSRCNSLSCFTGALLFSFYTIYKAPLFFNESAQKKVAAIAPESYRPLYVENQVTVNHNQQTALKLLTLRKSADAGNTEQENRLLAELKTGQKQVEQQRTEMRKLIKDNIVKIAEPESDSNYIFLHFVRHLLTGRYGWTFICYHIPG
jgi:SSS family solute:Na+ symporter